MDKETHRWYGEEASLKWIDLNLGNVTEMKLKQRSGEEVHFQALRPEGINETYYRCYFCGAVWDHPGYPKLEHFPVVHIKCPGCNEIIASEKETTKEEA